jgi:hypothetical protein
MRSPVPVIPASPESRGIRDIFDRPEWLRASASQLVRHGACCDRARSWLVAMARSHDYAATDGLSFAAPRWLAQRYAWGPTRWPIAWCQAVGAAAIDCGVFAAFALEIFRAKGIDAHPGQVLRSYAEASTTHWRHKWAALPGAFNWIGARVVFHEVAIVKVGRSDARIYDPTDGVWLDPKVTTGHGGHVAVRSEAPAAVTWGGHTLAHGQWTQLAALPDARRPAAGG